MMRMAQLGLTLAAGLLLTACAGDPTIDREAAVTLEPMAKPAALPAETTWTGKGAGVDRMVANDGTTVTMTRVSGWDEGCTWTRGSWFAPSDTFENCEGDSGTQQITKMGDIWPLQIGSKEVYEVLGKSEKYPSWELTRTCEVEDAVMVSVADKQLAAYEVVCSDRYFVNTWYVSPELGRAIRYKRWDRNSGLREDVNLQL